MTVRLRSCIKIVRVSFIKNLLLVLHIVPSELHILKGIGARLNIIALSKSASFPLRIEIARSLPMMLRLTAMVFTTLHLCYAFICTMHLFA